MVSFAMGLGYGGMPTSMIQPRTTQPKKTTKPKSLVVPRGLTQVGTGRYVDSKGNQVVSQKVGAETKFYSLKSESDDVFGYISYPTLYKPPPETKKERVEKKRVAIEQAVGSRTPIFEDLPQPDAPEVSMADLPDDATEKQKEEARQREEQRFRKREEERQARRNQLKTFAGQRRSLLRPAARRPYYA